MMKKMFNLFVFFIFITILFFPAVFSISIPKKGTATDIDPVAIDDKVFIIQDSQIDILVMENDYDPDGDNFYIFSFTQPSNGYVIDNNLSLIYVPNSGFYGFDSFNYTITDSDGGFDTAYVNITINQSYSPPVNNPPNRPNNPFPSDGLIDVENENLILSWNCSDPDNDDLKYNVYFGNTSSPVLVSENQTDNNYYIGILENETIYYWKIKVFDLEGLSNISSIWNFKTHETYVSNDDQMNNQTQNETDDTSNNTTVDDSNQTSSEDSEEEDEVNENDEDDISDEEIIDDADNVIDDEDENEDSNQVLNNAPYKPSVLTKKQAGVGERVAFIASSDDPDGDNFCFTFDFGDGGPIISSDFSRNTDVTEYHSYDSAGIFNVRINCKDDKEKSSSYVENLIFISVDTYLIDDIIDGYLVDYDLDGSYSSFFNLKNNRETEMMVYQTHYWINVDSDSDWEYVFSMENNSVYVWSEEEAEYVNNTMNASNGFFSVFDGFVESDFFKFLPIFIAAIFVVCIETGLVIVMKRKGFFKN